jgi:hypothetical protein
MKLISNLLIFLKEERKKERKERKKEKKKGGGDGTNIGTWRTAAAVRTS